MKRVLSALIGTFLALSSSMVSAEDALHVEIVPYMWAAGIDGDISAGDREVEVDVGFDDLLDAVDIAGSFLTVVEYNDLIMWGQFDYLALDSDNLDNAPDRARVESDATMATLAVGYRLCGFTEESTIDLLVGARYLGMENEISLGDFDSVKRDRDIFDGVVVLRPLFQLTDSIAFNPTMSIGTGDSDLTYELQPQFQFLFSDTVVARLGYRRLYYDYDGDRASFDGAFHGLIAGLGVVL